MQAIAFVFEMGGLSQPGGVALNLRVLRGFFNWCVEDGIVHTNPFARQREAIPKKIKPTPSDAKVDAMLRKAGRHRRDFALLADTGCLKGEIAVLKVDNIDLTSGVVHFSLPRRTQLVAA